MRKWLALGVVGGCIALFAWHVIGELRTALDRSRQKRTMADMRSIATALEARAGSGQPEFATSKAGVLDFASLPPVSMPALERMLVPEYLRTLPRLDGWGNEFEVRIRGRAYAIRSVGKDDRADAASYEIGQISRFREDILFSDGNWIRYPEGL